MATFYSIEPGYNPEASRAVVIAHLKQECVNIVADSSRVYMEVLRVEPDICSASLADVAEYFREELAQGHDTAFRVSDPEDAGGSFYIGMSASGGGPWRTAKEAYRRAVFRLLLESCHKLGLNINLRTV